MCASDVIKLFLEATPCSHDYQEILSYEKR